MGRRLGTTAAALLVALVAGMAGCATTYGPRGIDGGYSESRRADDIYIVRFEGNGFTKPDQAEEMAFLRAAELTIEKGFRYFTILGESSATNSTAVPMPAQNYTTGAMNSYGGFQARTTTAGGVPLVIRTPSARLHIGMTNYRDMAGRTMYEAAGIVADLRPKYVRPAP
jgi:hypothetical protein